MKSLLIKQLQPLGLLRGNGKALDLGFGLGHETSALAELGYEVVAVDRDKNNIKNLKPQIGNLKIELIEESIESYQISNNSYDIIIAKNSLSFVAPRKTVFEIIKRIARGLKDSGIVYLTLFGPKDSWADRKEMSFFEFDEVMEYLNQLNLKHIHRSTEEGLAPKMDGSIKYWHIHKFLYQK